MPPFIPDPPQPAGESIRRHSLGARLLHWATAFCFLVAMTTGLALYWRPLLGWTLRFWGGKAAAVDFHFGFGLGLALAVACLFVVWRRVARWTAGDTEFVRHLRRYAAGSRQLPPPDTGFFNGGQKLYLWAVVAGTLALAVTGLAWWYRADLPHGLYAVCRTTHRVLAVTLSGAFLVHLYKATLGEPGTFASMISGTVSREWARTRRPKWHRDLGRPD